MNPKLQKFMQNAFPVPQRVVLAILGFFAIVNAYTMRICLSVAITKMVKPIINVVNATSDELICEQLAEDAIDAKIPISDQFEWSEELQGVILSSFYWGYVITHMPGGIIAEKFGGKYVLSLGILSTAVLTLLTPMIIDYGGAELLITLRFFEGLGEGTTFPALSTLIAAWTPLKERSMLGSLVFGGGQVGTIISSFISGFLIDYFDNWRVVFYFFGVMALIWFFFFSIMCYNDPASHPYIKESEKQYLAEELGQLKRDASLPPTPWKKMLTNSAVLALIAAQIGHDFGFFVMVTDLPKYFNDVLKFNIKKNAVFTALPYIFMWIISIVTGISADIMIKQKCMSITNARKLYTTIASFVPSVLIIGASYAGCDHTAVIVLFTMAMGTMGTYYPGMKVNGIDLTPNYAGTLMATTNGIGAITGIIGPSLVGFLTPNRYISEWRLVFWISFAIFNITNIIYLIWASGEVQPFNNPVALKTEEPEDVPVDLPPKKPERSAFMSYFSRQ